MKYTVYILFSKKDDGLYVGHTSNLSKRFKEHASGRVKSTHRRLPLILIHQEVFNTRREATKREKFLKSLYGAKEKRGIIKNFLSNGSSEPLSGSD